MKITTRFILIFCQLVVCAGIYSQNEQKKWHFGVQAGLDFMTNPPTVLTTGVMTALEGCASVADQNGNLLFYTDGAVVWNQSHLVMANGNTLFGNSASSQSALIIKRPGNNPEYYIITQGSGTGGLCYSIVDMSLAGGQGSVTVKNTTLVAPAQCTEKLTGTRHCNGVDFWFVTHDVNNNNFRSYLVTNAGINPVPVISSAGSTYTAGLGYQGWMKISQNGKKLGATMYTPAGACELFDFNNTTGVVSNALSLTGGVDGYGCEFSPDGTKFYAAETSKIYQWDLCAGAGPAIVASRVDIPAIAGYAMQLATNGKIYVSRTGQQFVGVINNPNNTGLACNYVDAGQSVNPKSSNVSIPNFVSGYMGKLMAPPSFTYAYNNTTGCQTASFTAPPNPTVYCPAAGYSLTGIQWNFGDPNAGANNTSTLTNPSHFFTTMGNYTVQLVLYYSCGGGSDTLKQPVSILGPSLSVSSSSVSCASLGTATISATGGVGPFSYTWNPSGQTNSIASNLAPGTYTINVFDAGVNCAFTSTLLLSPPLPMTGTVAHTQSLSCNGAATGTAAVTALLGGTGNNNYLWTNGINTQTTAVATGLSAGNYTLTATDAISNCVFTHTFQITQPPAVTVNVSAASASACAGTGIAVTGTASGGLGAFSYSWANGPASNNHTVTAGVGGIYIYTLTATDGNNCSRSNTLQLTFANSPNLSLASVSICPLTVGILTVTGANTYTWSNNTQGNSLAASPTITSVFSVTGAVAGCTSVASANIFLMQVPAAAMTINNPVCVGKAIQLNGLGGAGYNWTGPQNFTSAQPSPIINPSTPAHAGAYNVTVTSAFGCTATASGTVNVVPSPTVSASGSTVCAGQPVNLNANSNGTSYQWAGPNGYSSSSQNPVISVTAPGVSGVYTVWVNSANSCTDAAVANVTVTAMPIAYITGPAQRCNGESLSLTGTGGGLYNWVGPGGFNSVFQSPVINPVSLAGSGVYTLYVTVGPCVALKTHSVTIHPLPPVIKSAVNPLCETKTLTLSVLSSSNVSTFIWQGPQGYVQASQFAVRDSMKLSYAGIYTITVTDVNTCKSSDTVNVVVLQNPLVTASSATVCRNSQGTLVASGADNYFWTGPGGYYSGTAAATIFSASNVNPVQYTVVGTALNSCTAIATASLSTKDVPLPAIRILPRRNVCLNSALTFIGSGGSLYEWNGPGNVMFKGDTVTLDMNSTNFSGTYTLTVTDPFGCRAATTDQIEIYGLPGGSLISDIEVGCVPFCANFSYFSASPNSTAVTVNWELQSQSIPAKTFTHCFIDAGNYVVKGKFTDTLTSCRSESTFTVEAYPLPKADFHWLPEEPVENIDLAAFTNQSNGIHQSRWTWYFATEFPSVENEYYASVSEGQSAMYRYREAGTYPVALVVKNQFGCSDSVIKLVTVVPDFNIYIPDAFTPNGDGDNDIFLPIVRGVKKYHFAVYNRGGILLFETEDPMQGWDGLYMGKACQTQVYTWKIILSTTAYYKEGVAKELTGHVTLYR